MLLAAVTFGAYVYMMGFLYPMEAMLEGDIPSGFLSGSVDMAGLRRYDRLCEVFIMLSWTAIFAVKFSFLSFFKPLVRRVRPWELLWRCVVGLTLVTWLGSCVLLVVIYLSYPDRGSCESSPSIRLLKDYKRSSGKVNAASNRRNTTFLAFITAFDILTDLAGTSSSESRDWIASQDMADTRHL